jgi:phenylacetate-CoA ligase
LKLNTQILLYIIDLFQGTSIRNYYNFYISTALWDRQKVKDYQLSKLKELLIYAGTNVPWYRNLFKSINFDPVRLVSFDQLKCIPPLKREDIQNNIDSLTAEGLNKDELFEGSSSGTSGIPLRYYKDKNAYSSGVAAGYFGCSLSGWKPGDRTLHIWGNPSSVKHWEKTRSRIKTLLKNQKNIPSTDFNFQEKLPELYEYIVKGKYDSIDGYTTAIFELSEYIKINNLEKLNAGSVFTTAENLNEYQKESIEQYIGPVSDDYGCGEINSIAMQPAGMQKYYIFDPHVFIETEEEKGEFKNIIVTDLNNKGMPFIRYRVGDLIDSVNEPEKNDKINFRWFKKIAGRESDIINLPGGRKILPVNILGGTLFRQIGGIKKHKVIWNGRELIFCFETGNDFNLERAEKLVFTEFSEYNVPVIIKQVENLLPDKNGKFRYFEILTEK